jgi:hypothetical protein
MKKRSQALLASAVLAGGSAATAVAAEPPLKTLPSPACRRAQEDRLSAEGLDSSNETYAIYKVDRHASAVRTHGVQKSILLL